MFSEIRGFFGLIRGSCTFQNVAVLYTTLTDFSNAAALIHLGCYGWLHFCKVKIVLSPVQTWIWMNVSKGQSEIPEVQFSLKMAQTFIIQLRNHEVKKINLLSKPPGLTQVQLQKILGKASCDTFSISYIHCKINPWKIAQDVQ